MGWTFLVSNSGRGKLNLSSPKPCRPDLETLSVVFIGTEFLHGVNRPQREANNSSPSSVEFKNEWSYTSAHHTPAWGGHRLL
jgi:hypothetical protein